MMQLKTQFKLVLFFSLLFLFVAGCHRSIDKKKHRHHDVIFIPLKGKQLSLHELKGKWVVLNYWADWCTGCLQEIPALNNFYKKHIDKVVVLGVNFDRLPLSRLKKLVSKINITFPVLINDPAKALGLTQPPGLPATYIINPEGKMVMRLFGKQNENSLEKFLGLNKKEAEVR